MGNKYYLFKVKDYTEPLVGSIDAGKSDKDQTYFVVMRGDGTEYRYEDYRVEWFKELVHKVTPLKSESDKVTAVCT